MCDIFEKAISILQNQSNKFMDTVGEDGTASTLGDLCGAAMHCSGREPYFYEFSYRVISSNTTQIALPMKPREMSKWCCDPNKCVLPEEPQASRSCDPVSTAAG